MKIRRHEFANATVNSLIVLSLGFAISACTSTGNDYQQISDNQIDTTRTETVQANNIAGQNSVAKDDTQLINPGNHEVAARNPYETQKVRGYYSDDRQANAERDQPLNSTRSLQMNRDQDQRLDGIARLSMQTPGEQTPNVFDAQKELEAEQRIKILDASIKHSVCKGGWATQPDKLEASEVTPGHPYYMEMRLRHTPLLPVGHTYIAYGRLSPDGKALDERLIMLSPVGGYGGAAVAAAVPMPGVLSPVTDDCRIKPIAAYRITLTAVQYEQLLLRIKQAHEERPTYSLFAYNCNHFATDIAASVGLLPPKNIYVPALKYIYEVIEANKNYKARVASREIPT